MVGIEHNRVKMNNKRTIDAVKQLDARGAGPNMIANFDSLTRDEEEDLDFTNQESKQVVSPAMGGVLAKLKENLNWYDDNNDDQSMSRFGEADEDKDPDVVEDGDEEDGTQEGIAAESSIAGGTKRIAAALNDAVSSVGGDDVCHTLDLTHIKNSHLRDRTVGEVKNLLQWINRLSGLSLRACADRSGVTTIVQMAQSVGTASEMQGATAAVEIKPDSHSTSPVNETSEYIEIIKAFRAGVYFESRQPGGKRSRIITTSTPGFQEPALKSALDNLTELTVGSLTNAILKKEKKNVLFKGLYNLKKYHIKSE